VSQWSGLCLLVLLFDVKRISCVLSVCLYDCSTIFCLSARPSISLSVDQSVCLPVRQSVYLPVRQSVYLPVYLSVGLFFLSFFLYIECPSKLGLSVLLIAILTLPHLTSSASSSSSYSLLHYSYSILLHIPALVVMHKSFLSSHL
jgi:hypothetical protein